MSVDGDVWNTFGEVERATQRPQVEIIVFRDGEEISDTVPTVALDGTGIDRVVFWAGALLQPPHRAISVQRGIAAEGVYVSYFGLGSPASRSRLLPGLRIVSVDGQATPDLDRFVAAVSGLGDRESVRLNTVTWNGVPQVITLTLDNHYWPAYEVRREGQQWRRYSALVNE